MLRQTIALLVMAALVTPFAAHAQFGIDLSSLARSAQSSSSSSEKSTDNGCKVGKKKHKGLAILGSIAGSVGGSALGGVGGMARFIPVSLFSTTLTEAIACRLDPKEQEQAAVATTTAVRSEKVGKTTKWKSDTRPEVTGTSTVTAKVASSDGSKCMMVSDVIIVNGEETRADKKMCRARGASGYVLSA